MSMQNFLERMKIMTFDCMNVYIYTRKYNYMRILIYSFFQQQKHADINFNVEKENKNKSVF